MTRPLVRCRFRFEEFNLIWRGPDDGRECFARVVLCQVIDAESGLVADYSSNSLVLK